MSEGRITLRSENFKLNIAGELGGMPTITHQYIDGTDTLGVELRANSDIAYYINHKQCDKHGRGQRDAIIFEEIKREAGFYKSYAWGPIAPRFDIR